VKFRGNLGKKREEVKGYPGQGGNNATAQRALLLKKAYTSNTSRRRAQNCQTSTISGYKEDEKKARRKASPRLRSAKRIDLGKKAKHRLERRRHGSVGPQFDAESRTGSALDGTASERSQKPKNHPERPRQTSRSKEVLAQNRGPMVKAPL